MDFVFNFAKNKLKYFTMKAIDIIKTRQLEWAKRKGIKTHEKYQYYCEDVNANIYGGKLYENVLSQFNDAQGNELKEGRCPAKIKAIFSSSALCVNLFQYFTIEEGKKDALELLVACKLISDGYNGRVVSIKFEETGYKIKDISAPNIDVVVKIESTKKQLFVIESKFTEPYSSHCGNFLKEKYCMEENREIWENDKINGLYDALGIDCKKNDSRLNETEKGEEIEYGRYIFDYKHLDGAQLLKHILGTVNNPDGKDHEITLVYLWYDALGEEGTKHREEIEDFRKRIETNSKIKVRHATYQEIIANLCRSEKMKSKEHENYINYIAERYL
jgi:hypothetical protein